MPQALPVGAGKVVTLEVMSEKTVPKPWQFNRVLGYLITVIRTQQGSNYFDLPDRVISNKK